MESNKSNKASVILFYKYGQLSNNQELMESYCKAMKDLCQFLNLKGRILIGLSNKSEGINGTLAGNYENVYAFTMAMHGTCKETKFINAIKVFWKARDELSKKANIPTFLIESPNDFKWSFPSSHDLFPDLNVKLVNEIINTGGKFSSISMDDTCKGYLTPEEWHERIKKDSNKVIIDVRNQKEFAIGHFEGALDPKTKTFEQFPQWVDQHKTDWKGKEIYMYCTGGIRCEKASAYVRNVLPTSNSVYHLKGGIHKYLERYGANGLFQGKNFVFDRRGADDPSQRNIEETNLSTIVGKCLYCQRPWDIFAPDTICTVCREPVLICHECKVKVKEYHCVDHYYLKSCYFTNLSHFTIQELQQQYQQLQQFQTNISIGKKFKQRRKTLQKQMNKIQDFIKQPPIQTQNTCRSCGDISCTGSCWGFHGLERKEKIDNSITTNKPRQRKSSTKRISKIEQKQKDIEEIQRLQLSNPSSTYRDSLTSIRCPPPCTRILQTRVKGKWYGKNIMDVLKNEFDALSKPNALEDHLNHSLILINHKPVTSVNPTSSYLLKNMDIIGRIVHWHEPPILVPSTIHVQKIHLPESISSNKDDIIYCCDKPSTVPTHPVGPYLSNSLTFMVEAQESLETRSLIPCHRLDRVTSGLTLCCASPNVARLLQTCMSTGDVKKLYLAKVNGKFPSIPSEGPFIQSIDSSSWKWQSSSFGKCLEINAPIETKDPKLGIRIISINGKHAKTRFQYLQYDKESHTTLIACYPITGRSHQIRVHLQCIGFPILDDVQYGGHTINTNDVWYQTVKKSLIQSKNENHLEEDNNARKICPICKYGEKGIESSFTSAQLLQKGHSIHLHAFKYILFFYSKKRKASDEKKWISKLDFMTHLPPWAKHIQLDVLTNIEKSLFF